MNNFPSQLEIGERCIFKLEDNFQSNDFYVRAVIFTNMKVRYSLYYAPKETTIHNIDSIFILEYKNENGEKEKIEFDGDNYS